MNEFEKIIPYGNEDLLYHLEEYFEAESIQVKESVYLILMCGIFDFDFIQQIIEGGKELVIFSKHEVLLPEVVQCILSIVLAYNLKKEKVVGVVWSLKWMTKNIIAAFKDVVLYIPQIVPLTAYSNVPLRVLSEKISFFVNKGVPINLAIKKIRLQLHTDLEKEQPKLKNWYIKLKEKICLT